MSLSGSDGDVGGSQKLTLKGDNPPVYRGALDFTDNKGSAKKGPKIESVGSGLDAGAKVASNDDSSNTGVPAGGVEAVGSGGEMVPSSAFGKTAEEEAVQGHPKGCGCVAAGLTDGAGTGALCLGGLGLVGLAVVRRRRSC